MEHADIAGAAVRRKNQPGIRSNSAQSTPAPIGMLVITLPELASITISVGFSRQAMNSRLFFASYASPVGVFATVNGKRFFTSSDFGSKHYHLAGLFAIEINQAVLADHRLLAVTFHLTVPTTSPVAASIAVTLCDP
jgi:hypothetical protein